MIEQRIEQYKAKVLDNVLGSADEMLGKFLQVMPQTYFESNDERIILQHMSAILLAQNAGNQEQIVLSNRDSTQMTFIQFKNYSGLLSDILDQLPEDKSLQAARAYTADDNSLAIDVFDFAELEETDDVLAIRAKRSDELVQQKSLETPISRKEVQCFIDTVTRYYLHRFDISEIMGHWQLVKQVRGSLDSVMSITPVEGAHNLFYIAYAAGQVESTNLFKRLSRYIHTLGGDIRETFLKNFDLNTSSQTALSVLLVQLDVAEDQSPPDALLRSYNNDITRLPYLDQAVLDVSFNRPEWPLQHAEVLVALCHLSDQVLAGSLKEALSREVIKEMALSHQNIALKICEAFILKFSKGGIENSAALLNTAKQMIRDEVAEDIKVRVLNLLVQLVDATLKCNINLPGRYALALRLAPDVFVSETRADRAFGIFFVHGKAFDGFHVRFRDIARGGVRIVRPSNIEQYSIEHTQLFDEVYQLASAQQLKNKDIPEGGSKGIILVKPKANALRCGKSFVNSLLDLIIDNQFLEAPRQDYYDQPELLFLGPDENVSVELIEWIIERASFRQYALPNALMSSKPSAGINHKVYGVTSEGVNVFLEVGLNNIGINPKLEPFTIKITGGPDGDVAGNLIKILHRDYGENAKIVGIADGSGCAECADGLCHSELLRLVNSDRPIAEFNPVALGEVGRVLSIAQSGGAEARNTLHNRVQSDVFVPAGGRPGTINKTNYQHFLNDQGAPSSRLIVEGANLFLTFEARSLLTQNSVMIVKDSSANKGGVICSSYEIIAGMVLTSEKFLEIKDVFVVEVIDRLREFALFEAKTLFREHFFRRDQDLSSLSMELSAEIIRMTDSVTDLIQMERIKRTEYNDNLMMAFFPESLKSKVGEKLLDKLPLTYAIRAMASILASRIIYHQGIGYLGRLNEAELAEFVLEYLQREERTGALIRQLENSDIADKSEIIQLMKLGGTGTAMRWLN